MAIRFLLPPPADRVYVQGPVPLLRATIARGDVSAGRPHLRVEHAPGRFMRVVAGARTLFWAKVRSCYEGVWVLAAKQAHRPPLPLAPFTVADVRSVDHPPGSEAWQLAWARLFARELVSSQHGLFHDGIWEIASTDAKLRDRRTSGSDADGMIAVHGDGLREPTFESWQLNGSNATIPLRPFSSESAGRVKALRKLARDGTLPPLLTWFVSGLDLHLLLDGHDRFIAAKLEGVTPTRLMLSVGREVRWGARDPKQLEGEVRRAELAMSNAAALQRRTADAVNARLVQAFAEPREIWTKTRAYPLPGGAVAWRREVEARLAEMGAPTDHAMLDG